MSGRSIFQKIWDEHLIRKNDDGSHLLYVDCHLLNEATSPQAFSSLRTVGRATRRPQRTVAVTDRAVPTVPTRSRENLSSQARLQVDTLSDNCTQDGIILIGMDDPRQGIVHVMGPELGLSQPGSVVVCGDSHTSTHGAFGALAFGIGTSEVEHVLATQTIRQMPSRTMNIVLRGSLGAGVYAKDVILALIGRIGAAGALGHAIEYSGSFIDSLSMEGRMTICNMSIEAGARAGMIGPDEKTYAYLEGRPAAPKGRDWERALSIWPKYRSDPDTQYDRVVELEVSAIAPQVTWGNSPQDVAPINGRIPDPANEQDELRRRSIEAALNYMGLEPDSPIEDLKIDHAFIGSCTNGRLEDLVAAAAVVRGRRIAAHVKGTVVPGSQTVKRAAEALGLHHNFLEAGFEWRESGCSMCVALNGDRVAPGARCASTSNRNFPGRQGPGSRTHLMSPAMVAAAAVAGRIIDVREVNR